MDTLNTAERREGSNVRIQNTIAQATEFVVVSWVQPNSSDGKRGWYDYETYDNERTAYEMHRDYERGEYSHRRAVCIFASKHGVPIGRVL